VKSGEPPTGEIVSPLTSTETAPVAESVVRLGGPADRRRDATIVIPVNAQADLDNVCHAIAELGRYQGRYTFDVVLVVNNYSPDEEPPEVAAYRDAGVRVVALPSAWRPGEAVCLSARVPGIREAATDTVILLDADTRIPNPTALLDWYVERFRSGASAAYTHVGYYDVRPLWSVRARIAAHHASRWVKRVVLRVPTTRGSNYAVRRSAFLAAYEEGAITDDLNSGPALKAAGGRVDYSGARHLVALTSGRKFLGGWRKLVMYLAYRLRYNLRVLRLDPSRPRGVRNPFHQKPLR
jgi:glycosyltransferase involved in cell wall biosynthesis